MSALTANANSVTIVSESSNHVVVRLFLHQNSAGNLSSNLVVNADTLSHRTQILTIDPGMFFPPGSVVNGDDSQCQATVCYNIDANTILVTSLSGNTAGFDTNDVLMGNHEGTGNDAYVDTSTGANVVAVVNPPRRLNIIGMTWSVQGPNASVGLEFSNGTVETAMMLSGQGYYGKNELQLPISTTLANSDGHLYVSTYNVPAGGGYTITLSLRKAQGFAAGGY